MKSVVLLVTHTYTWAAHHHENKDQKIKTVTGLRDQESTHKRVGSGPRLVSRS